MLMLMKPLSTTDIGFDTVGINADDAIICIADMNVDEVV